MTAAIVLLGVIAAIGGICVIERWRSRRRLFQAYVEVYRDMIRLWRRDHPNGPPPPI